MWTIGTSKLKKLQKIINKNQDTREKKKIEVLFIQYLCAGSLQGKTTTHRENLLTIAASWSVFSPFFIPLNSPFQDYRDMPDKKEAHLMCLLLSCGS